MADRPARAEARELEIRRFVAEALIGAFKAHPGAFVLGGLDDPDGVVIDGSFNLLDVAAVALAALAAVNQEQD